MNLQESRNLLSKISTLFLTFLIPFVIINAEFWKYILRILAGTFIFPTCMNIDKYVYEISCWVKLQIYLISTDVWSAKRRYYSQRKKFTAIFKILLKIFELKINSKECLNSPHNLKSTYKIAIFNKDNHKVFT